MNIEKLLRELPPPPTGPEAKEYLQEEGSPKAFREFIETDIGRLFWKDLQRAALENYFCGESRFSCRGFLHSYRASHKVRINDHFTPWFSDLLVATHPRLVETIERRVRKKVGPFDK